MGTLGSLFLQQAHRFSLQSTGFAIGSIFLMAIISNPLIGSLSDRGRIRWGFIILSVAALVVGIFPHLPKTALIPGLMTYGFFLPASYPVIEAALIAMRRAPGLHRSFGVERWPQMRSEAAAILTELKAVAVRELPI